MSMTDMFKALDLFVQHSEDPSIAITSLAAAEEYLKKEAGDEVDDDPEETHEHQHEYDTGMKGDEEIEEDETPEEEAEEQELLDEGVPEEEVEEAVHHESELADVLDAFDLGNADEDQAVDLSDNDVEVEEGTSDVPEHNDVQTGDFSTKSNSVMETLEEFFSSHPEYAPASYKEDHGSSSPAPENEVEVPEEALEGLDEEEREIAAQAYQYYMTKNALADDAPLEVEEPMTEGPSAIQDFLAGKEEAEKPELLDEDTMNVDAPAEEGDPQLENPFDEGSLDGTIEPTEGFESTSPSAVDPSTPVGELSVEQLQEALDEKLSQESSSDLDIDLAPGDLGVPPVETELPLPEGGEDVPPELKPEGEEETVNIDEPELEGELPEEKPEEGFEEEV